MGERGDRFARWFVALPQGRKFILSAGMAVTTILAPTLLATQFVPAQTGSSNEITVWCDPQGRKTIDGVETPKVTVSPDDPRFDESDLDATMFRLCALL
ncbi:hypothetical protein [Mycobacterium kyogaense]|uniref:hypothetical protein n=1 Tax=Mycobacterium kyogaense TaxID=2212479 RepID=UPI000DAF1654|nr:hypothetical protein [Mycobacterium kyogaense]